MKSSSRLGRLLVLIYGVTAYVVFLATFLYAIGFVGDTLVPKSIDSPSDSSTWTAVPVNLGLLGVFALQQSVMAPFLKKRILRFIPAAAERSTYTLAASLALAAMFLFWQPIGGIVWQVENPVWRLFLHGARTFGWLLVLSTTFLVNHCDLFGLRQVWLHFRNRPYPFSPLRPPGLSKRIQRPLYLGLLLAVWSAPTMTAAHLFFAFVTTNYILVGIHLEDAILRRVPHAPIANPVLRAGS